MFLEKILEIYNTIFMFTIKIIRRSKRDFASNVAETVYEYSSCAA